MGCYKLVGILERRYLQLQHVVEVIVHLQAQRTNWRREILTSSGVGTVEGELGCQTRRGVFYFVYRVSIVGAVIAGWNIQVPCYLVQTERG